MHENSSSDGYVTGSNSLSFMLCRANSDGYAYYAKSETKGINALTMLVLSQ